MVRSVPMHPEVRRFPGAAFQLSGIMLGSLAVFVLSARHNWLEQLLRFSVRHEDLQLDELFTVALFLTVGLGWFACIRWREAVHSQRRLLEKNAELGQALSELQQLRGIIPICASCKKVRDDQGYWHQVEQYIRERTEARFSHGLCPECMERLYPGMGTGRTAIDLHSGVEDSHANQS